MSIEDQRAANDADCQFGDTVTLDYVTAAGLATNVANNLIKWQGVNKTDVRAWRVYLGPWTTKPEITIAAGSPVTYERVVPWANNGPADRFDSFQRGLQLYARITFGSGGASYIAYVDWPVRGALVQVSGSYVQVDVTAASRAIVAADSPRLPIVSATLAPEPGGGDSAQPGTFTYQIDTFVDDTTVMTFQIPPFARTFNLLPSIVAATGPANISIQVAGPRGGGGTTVSTTYNRTLAAADGTEVFPIPSFGADVIITASGGTPPYTAANLGVMFQLDL